MASLQPIFQILAREMALGFSLEDICLARDIPLDSAQKVARGSLFKAEVARISAAIEQEVIETAGADPVIQKLKGLALHAVDTLSSELTNYDSEMGGSAATRLQASKAILDRSGYNGQVADNGPSKIILMISEDKLATLRKASEVVLESVPDYVDGHLALCN